MERRPQPSPTQIILFAGALVLATFLFRLVQPLDTEFFNMQLGFFAQYIAVFSAGVLAGRYGWIEGLASSSFAARAGWLALIAGPLGLTAALFFGGAMQSGNFQPFKGGWHWQAFGLAVWEQLSGVALGLGAMALFRRRFNSDGPLLRWLARHSFGVYVLHAPILVALTLLMHPLSTGPVVKMLLLTVFGLIFSHAAAALALRMPGLRRIL